MQRIVLPITSAERVFRSILKYISILALLGITVIINGNVFFRFVLSNSIPWAEGVSTLLNTWVAFIGGAIALYVGDHVKIKYAQQKLPSGIRRHVLVIINLLIAVLGISMLWYGGHLAISQAGNKFLYLGISHLWLWLPLALCGGYLILESGRRQLETLTEALEDGEVKPFFTLVVLSLFLLSLFWIGFLFPEGVILELIVMFTLLIGLILFGMPIAFAMALSVLLFIILFTNILEVIRPMLVIQQMGQGMRGFSILAIPMFIYAGRLMSVTGITTRIVDFANLIVGRMRAGLSHANVVSSMLFAGISGSAVADTAAIGSILIPAMEDEGYSKGYSCAITCSSAIIGPIIPPSIIMIIYAITVPEVGVGELFLAGVGPGILFGIGLIVVTYIYGNLTNWREFPEVETTEPPTGREALQVVRDAMLALFMPLIIIGGILSGIFTATEAGAVAVGYSLLVGALVYRQLSLRDFIDASYKSATISGVTLFIIAAAMPLTQVMAIKDVPLLVSDILLGISEAPLAIMFLIVGLLSILALFIEEIANIILWAPVFSPLAVDVGLDPLHFGIVMMMTLAIGMITPPLGVTLFVAAPIGSTDIEDITSNIAPFFIAEIIVLLTLILFPEIALALPRALGY